MSEPKAFDCVQMKREIQDKIRLQNAGLSQQEALRRQREAVQADPILGPFLARVRTAASSTEPTFRSSRQSSSPREP